MRWLSALSVGLLAGFASPASASPGDGPFSEYDGVTVDAPPGVEIDAVSLDNNLGDVRIEGHDKDTITIEAFKRAPDVETLRRLTVSFTSDPHGPVSISTELKAGEEARPVPAGSVRVDLVVHVPRAARPKISVWKGQVEVQGLDNGAVVSANEGDIEVRHVSGDISTDVAHGRQEFEEVVGATIDAQSVEGDMDLKVVRGKRLQAVVHRGQVKGRSVRFREITVRTMRGDISLQAELVAGGRYRIASYRGNVEVVLTSKTPARIKARARKGRVAVADDFSPERDPATDLVLGRLGEAEKRLAEMVVRSKRGNVNVALARW